MHCLLLSTHSFQGTISREVGNTRQSEQAVIAGLRALCIAGLRALCIVVTTESAEQYDLGFTTPQQLQDQIMILQPLVQDRI